MRTGRWAWILLAAVSLLTGCSGFWDALPSSDTGTNPASGIFYVLNRTTNQIAGFSFTAGASSPTAVSGSPWALGSEPFAMAIAPGGSFLYVSTASGIYLYTVGTSGALTIGNSGSPISTDVANAMQVDPSGSWLIEAISGVDQLYAIPLNANTGLQTGSGTQYTTLPASTIQQIAVSPSSSSYPYVFVAMGTGGTAVIPFTAGNANPFGSVARFTAKNSLGGDNAVAVAPDNSLLYVGETAAVSATQSGGLRVFTIGSSGVSEISGSPYSTGGTGPSSILPATGYVYVANSAVSGSTAGNITGFSVATSGTTTITYSLTTINTVSTGIQTESLAEDSTDAYLLAVNYGGSPDLSTFTFDTTTAGQLDAGPTAATGTDPVGAWAIAAAP
jgi:6-phosphogluconolactonase